MIKNFGAYLAAFIDHLESKTAITTVFGTRIFAGKPVEIQDDGNGEPYLYVMLINNSEAVGDDRKGTHIKRALLEFCIVGNGKDIPDQDLYTWLDVISNAIVTVGGDDTRIDLDGLTMQSIEEGAQSGVIREVVENPTLLAQYSVLYKYRY